MNISGEKLRVLKGKLQFLKWKLKSKSSRSQGAELFDVDKIYWIETNRIKLSLDSPARDRLNEAVDEKSLTPMLERGKIVGGDWDEKTIEFESQDIWQAFQQHFEEGKNWTETTFYQRVARTMQGGIAMWGCNTTTEFDERLKGIENLYDEIKTNGYRTQDKIDVGGYKPVGNEDEIQVHIGRDGDYIFGDGRHRLCIAKLLNLDKVPVKIARRHEIWVGFRMEILSYVDKQPTDKLYARLTHPDLEDIPAVHQGDDRFALIEENLPVKSGSVLDIGAHWGYFCHRLEKLGFDCAASEYLSINQYFIKKLRDVDKLKFSVMTDSILNYREKRHYDIVLALNIFHHFIKTEDEYKRLEAFLRGLDADCMFFESHAAGETQMRKQNAYKDLQPDEFAAWVQERAGFTKCRHLGETLEGRQLYVLDR